MEKKCKMVLGGKYGMMELYMMGNGLMGSMKGMVSKKLIRLNMWGIGNKGLDKGKVSKSGMMKAIMKESGLMIK